MNIRMQLSSLMVLFILTIITFIPVEVSAQSSWNEIYNNSGITVAYDIIDCHGNPTLLFRVDNDLGNEKMVDFTFSIKESDGSNEITRIPYQKLINASSRAEGSCPAQVSPSSDLYVLPQDYTNPTVTITMK